MGAGKPYGDERSKETLSIRFTRPGRYSPALSSSLSCACASRGRDNRAFTGKGTLHYKSYFPVAPAVRERNSTQVRISFRKPLRGDALLQVLHLAGGEA